MSVHGTAHFGERAEVAQAGLPLPVPSEVHALAALHCQSCDAVHLIAIRNAAVIFTPSPCWYRKKRSPFVGLVAIEAIALRKRPVACGHPIQCPAALVFRDFDLAPAIARGYHVQLVAFLQSEFFDQGLGEANRQTVTPPENLHFWLHAIPYKYVITEDIIEFKGVGDLIRIRATRA
jgi:hypothetical protein